MKCFNYALVIACVGSLVFATGNAAASTSSSVKGQETFYLEKGNYDSVLLKLSQTDKNEWNFSFLNFYTAKLKSVGPNQLFGMYKGSKKEATPDMEVNMLVQDGGAKIIFTVTNKTATGNIPETESAVRVREDVSPCAEVAGRRFCVGNTVTVSPNGKQLVPRVYNIQHLYYGDNNQLAAFSEKFGMAELSVLEVANVVDLSNSAIRCAKPGVCIGDRVTFSQFNPFQPVGNGTVLGFSQDGILLTSDDQSIVTSVNAAMDPVPFKKVVDKSCDDLSANEKKALWQQAAAEGHKQCLATGRADECSESPERHNLINGGDFYSRPTADGKGCQFVGSSMGDVSSPVK